MKIKLNIEKRAKYTNYSAGAIESVTTGEMSSWRDYVDEHLNKSIMTYNPVKLEAEKTGKPSGEHVEYCKGLKRAGKYDLFFIEMWKIWEGTIKPPVKLMRSKFFLAKWIMSVYMTVLVISFRLKMILYGNYKQDMASWGDTEAVCRSTFITCYMPKDTKTVGTIIECFLCVLFGIPIYLILPNSPKTEANSTLLFLVMLTQGEVFYSVQDCVSFINNKYH